MHRRIVQHQGNTHFTALCPIFVNRWEEGFTLAEHYHDFIEITYIAEGSGYHYVNGNPHSVRKGDILYLPINSSHVFRPSSASSKDRLIVYNCVFPKEVLHMSAFPSSVPLHEILPVLSTETFEFYRWWDEDSSIIRLFQEMHHEYSLKSLGYEHLLFSNLLKLILLLSRLGTKGHISDPTESFQKILSYIDIHYMESLTLEMLSKMHNMSKRHFYRIFQQVTGQTFTGYLQNKRIDISCYLLRRTTRKIADISRDVGYKDSKFYSTVFKQLYGITPSSYRRMNR